MPTIAYTLACETDRGGTVFGVYADRECAVDAARNLGTSHAAWLRAEDEATFKAVVAPDIYQVRLEDFHSRIVVTTYHRLLRERGSSYRWIVQEHEIVQTYLGEDPSLIRPMWLAQEAEPPFPYQPSDWNGDHASPVHRAGAEATISSGAK